MHMASAAYERARKLLKGELDLEELFTKRKQGNIPI